MNPRLKVLEDRRDTIKATLDKYDADVLERGKDLEGVEQENYSKLSQELASVVASHEEIVKRELAVAGSVTAASRLGGTVDKPTGDKPVFNARAQGDDTELIYRAEGEFDPLRDVLLAARGDGEARDRIIKHNRANVGRVSLHDRASGTSNIDGLVVPKYLTELYAPTAHELRPYVDSINNLPLDAYSQVIPIGTQGTTATVPSAQGVAYDVQSPTSSALTLTATSIAGVAELTIEAVTFGAYSQALLYQDLYRAYWQTTDVQALRGSDSAGQVEGFFNADGVNTLASSATSASSAAAGLYTNVLEGALKVYQGIFMPADTILMSAARWYRLLATVDANNRPLLGIRDGAPQNAMGSSPGKTFAEMDVVVDENIYAGTTDTAVIVYRRSEHLFFEQGAQVITVDQAKAAQGIVQYICRGFIQYTAERRPKAATKISGLPVPSF